MSNFSRRSFVASLGASLGAIAVPAELTKDLPGSGGRGKNPLGRRPNVIIIICDDLGYGDLGCYGSKLNTPNVDRMAGEGMRFTQFNAGHPICSASRSALLTGRYATRTGTKPVYFPGDKDGMDLDEVTLANLLHDKQYRSMCVGKWHLGDQPEYLPTSRGFDSYFGVPYSVDMRPLPMIKDKTVLEENTNRALLTQRYTDAAAQFIETSSLAPFFLYLAYSYPHIPISASSKFKGRSQQGTYGDAVEEIDWSVGEILLSLERKGIAEETLVIFTSDHGPGFQGSPALSRGRKGTTYEGGLRVPLVARWNNVIPAGCVSEEWTSNLDLLPTIAAICGAELPSKPLDGIDISAVLTGSRRPDRQSPILYFSGMRANGLDLQCARSGKWKLRIAQYAENSRGGEGKSDGNFLLASPELYDLDNDPGENYDVAGKHQKIVTQIMQQVENMMPGFPAKVAETYRELKKNVDSPTTPAAAPPRPPGYVAPPYYFTG